MGGTPFHTTQAKAIEFPVAALSPAHRKQAEGEGADLDAPPSTSTANYARLFRRLPSSVSLRIFSGSGMC